MKTKKFILPDSEMPKAWYNLRADMINKPAPLLDGKTMQPITEDALAQVFCRELAKQELDDTNPYIEIPQEIRDLIADSCAKITSGELVIPVIETPTK